MGHFVFRTFKALVGIVVSVLFGMGALMQEAKAMGRQSMLNESYPHHLLDHGDCQQRAERFHENCLRDFDEQGPTAPESRQEACMMLEREFSANCD